MQSLMILKYILSVFIDKILNRNQEKPIEKPRVAIFKSSSFFAYNLAGISDVHPSSIYTEFVNKYGKTICFSVHGEPSNTQTPDIIKKYKVIGMANYFSISGTKFNPKPELSVISSLVFEYCKEEILKILNSEEIGGNFSSIFIEE